MARHVEGAVHAPPSLTETLKQVETCGWYWGSISASDAKVILEDKVEGSFLVRNSCSDNYLLTLSYRTFTGIYHSRVALHKGFFCLGGPQSIVRAPNFVQLINQVIESSNDPAKSIIMYPTLERPTVETVRLKHPLLRHAYLPSLKYLCRCVIRQNMTVMDVKNLPLPRVIKKYLASPKYLLVHFSDAETMKKREQGEKLAMLTDASC